MLVSRRLQVPLVVDIQLDEESLEVYLCFICRWLLLPLFHVPRIKDLAGVHLLDRLDHLLPVSPLDVIVVQFLLKFVEIVEVCW